MKNNQRTDKRLKNEAFRYLKKNKLLLPLSILGTIIVCILFLRGADLESLVNTLLSVKPLPLFYAFLVLNLLQAIGSWRLLSILPPSVKEQPLAFKNALEINYLQQFYARILPLRLSDVLYMALIKKKFSVRINHNLAVYILMRIWDMRIILGALLITLSLVIGIDFEKNQVQSYLSFAVIIIGASMIIIITFPQFFMNLFSRFWLWIYRATFKVKKKPLWFKSILRFSLSIRRAYKHANSQLLTVHHAILATTNWAVAFISFYFIFQSISVDINLQTVVLLSSSLVLFNILPIQTIGGIGIGELGLSGMLVFLGWEVDQSLVIGFSVGIIHALLTLMLIFTFWSVKFSGNILRRSMSYK